MGEEELKIDTSPSGKGGVKQINKKKSAKLTVLR